MEAEWNVLKEREVFELVDAPPGMHIIDSMWVFANKYDADGNIIRHKAHLVAKGYTQIPGLDYDQTYASVVQLESFHMVAAITASLGLYIWNVMCQPPGFVAQGGQKKVLQVTKTLYSMMQGSYDFQGEMSSSYKSLGYYKSLANPCVHSCILNEEYTITSTYTDDILSASSMEEGAKQAKREIEACFKIKDLGDLGYILGIWVERNNITGAISLSQEAYL